MSDATPRKRRARTMQIAASKNVDLDELLALKQYTAKALDDCDSGRDKAALIRQYSQILKDIRDLGVVTDPEETAADKARKDAEAYMS